MNDVSGCMGDFNVFGQCGVEVVYSICVGVTFTNIFIMTTYFLIVGYYKFFNYANIFQCNYK